MKVLISGATGFVGTWIVDAWLAGGHEVRALVRDPQKAAKVLDPRVDVVTGDATDLATMERALEGREVMVHGAALLRYGHNLGDEMERTAPLLARTAFEAATRAGTSHVIDISVVIVLAPHRDGAGRLVTDLDSPVWPRTDIRWRDPYLASKGLAYAEAERAREKGVPVSSVLPGPIPGPRDRGPSPNGTVLRLLLTDRVLPDATMPWVDVRDVADIVVGIGSRPPGGGYLAAGPALSFREVAKVVDRVTGISRRHVWTAPAMTRATAALGRAYRPFEETVRDAITWWAANGLLTPAQAGLAAN